MGFFSFYTGDTKEPVPNIYQRVKEPFTVYMHAPDGRAWEEPSYEGYGDFGGKDIYELAAEINGYESDRDKGIQLHFGENNAIMPRLSRDPDKKWEDLEPLKDDPDQGFFYESGDN